MTPRQMHRAIELWQITTIYWKQTGLWYAAGPEAVEPAPANEFGFVIDIRNPVTPRSAFIGHNHCGATRAEAVEDYCNARDLEWDI